MSDGKYDHHLLVMIVGWSIWFGVVGVGALIIFIVKGC